MTCATRGGFRGGKDGTFTSKKRWFFAENVGSSLYFRRIKQAKSGIKLTKWGMMADDYDTVVKLVQAAHFHESHHPFQSIPRLHVFFDPFLKGVLLHLSSLSAEAANTSYF